MKLKAIVATATSETEANLIFAEIAKTHAFIEFFKIDSCQVTVIYEPDQSRFDRINKEADERCASLTAAEKSTMINKQLVGIEDLEAKLCELGLDKDYLVTASAWSASKPQWYEVHHKWPSIKPTVIRSNSADVVSCKLLEISDERQTLMMPEIEKTAQPCKTYLRLYAKGDRVFFFDHYHRQSPDKMKLATAITNQCGNELSILVDGEEDFGPQWGLTPGRRVNVSDIYDIYEDAADDNLIEEPNKIKVETTPEKTETEEEKSALPPIKKSADKLTIVDLEAKIKKLGLDKDLFVRVAISNPDKPQKYIIHDLDWNFQKPATFESVSAIAVSRKLSKIHKERQAAKVGHSLTVNPSQPIDIQKVCPHCDRLLEKDQICCVYSVLPTTAKQRQCQSKQVKVKSSN
mgnify:CR=1 FL=1